MKLNNIDEIFVMHDGKSKSRKLSVTMVQKKKRDCNFVRFNLF